MLEQITYESIIAFLKNVLDISLVWFLIYFILKKLGKKGRFLLLVKGIIIVILTKLLSNWLGLTTLGWIVDHFLMWGFLAIIIIFQPEIRAFLEDLGRNQLFGRHKVMTLGEKEHLILELTKTVEYFKEHQIGAIIAIERNVSLGEYIEKARKIYADISAELLQTIFSPNSPLHEGAVVIQGNKISCANTFFPQKQMPIFNPHFGGRHRAAITISEATDCIVIISSGDTGALSIAVDGQVQYDLTIDEFKVELHKLLETSSSEEERGHSHEKNS
ncbi:MAG TPA: TIGR00159 family protein [Tenericutes bacterium]|jgi:diadenylate cyclase|nr:TIGR00159 family protein [Mycoplasmatota bacterium]